MANNIKGITIDINGNTTALTSALKDVNKDIGKTQSELKNVERLLKLDPANTELLAQKQKLLSDQIGSTREKLTALKNAQEQAMQQVASGDLGEDKYRALQREIISTESQLKSLEKQAKNTNNTMADVGKSFSAAGEKISGLGNKLMPISAVAVSAGTALGALGVKAGATADDINTLAKQTGLSIEQIQVFQYASDRIDVSLETLTGSMAKLTKNMQSAKNGSKNTAEAFNILGVEYKNANGELRNNQDVMNDCISALAVMENETQRDALAMQIFGKSAQDLNPLILGGADALTAMAEEAREAGLILDQEVLDSANAFNDVIDEMKAVTSGAFMKIGAEIATALTPTLEVLADKAQIILDCLINLEPWQKKIILAVGLIAAALPPVLVVLGTLISSIGTVTTAISGLNAAMLANPVGLIVAGVVALVAALAVLYAKCEWFRDGVNEIWEQIKLAWQALVSALQMIWQTQTVQQIWENVWNVIRLFFEQTMDYIKTIFAVFTQIFQGDWEGAWNTLVDFFGRTWNRVQEMFTTYLDTIKMAFNKLTDWLLEVFQTDWSERFGVFGEILNVFCNNIANYIEAAKQTFNGIINFIKGVFTGNWQLAWEGVKQLFEGVFMQLLNIAKTPLNGIIGLINGVIIGLNALIKGLNKIKIDAPDWVTQLTGITSFGIDIPQIPKIPYLAKGGILTNGSAIVGEAGAELLTVDNGRAMVQPLNNSQKNAMNPQIVQNFYVPTATPYETQKATAKGIRAMRLAVR